MTATPLIGAGFRPELPGLFNDPAAAGIDVAELIADRYFAAEGFNRAWELDLLREHQVPTVIHGLSGNAASATGPTREYLATIRTLADAVDCIAYSDHLALTGTTERSLGHLAPNRFDDDLLAHVVTNIDLMADMTDRRPRLENLATTIMMSGSTYSVEEFYLRLLDASDRWDCLVDVTNLWINAQNRELDPYAFVDAIPPDRLRYVHLAGGHFMHGEWVDSHSHAVHDGAFDILEHLLTHAVPDVIIVERDTNWEGAEEQVRADIARARSLVAASPLLVAA
ncbi:MAG TPA: DUF692 family protein [Mycobacteriales bacterium]|nr:DUF692 family protein [Mycobacteriales bacterium]